MHNYIVSMFIKRNRYKTEYLMTEESFSLIKRDEIGNHISISCIPIIFLQIIDEKSTLFLF